MKHTNLNLNQKLFIMKNLKLLLLFVMSMPVYFGIAQQCDTAVPLYIIDLSANADSTWVLFEEDALDRNGQCCNATTNENCIQFQITTNSNCAGIFFDYDGAGAYGSLDWQIDCGPEYNLKDTICLTGGGTVLLTFCKPGTDNGNYTLVSVPQPTFPEDQFVPENCEQPVEVLGVTQTTIVWQSISPGAPGDYDSLLTCTNCLTPVYKPIPGGPTQVAYQVCGYPILDYCVGEFDFCDTVVFNSLDSIKLNITPANPSFCLGGSVDLTANGSGGDGNYTFIWYNDMLQPIDTGVVLTATSPGTYTCEIRDGNYDPLYCDNFFESVTVVETNPPVVNAGADQLLCADGPEVTLNGTIQYATGGVWSGGNGTYNPSSTDLNATYTPTQAEIAGGVLNLTLTTTGAGSSCSNASDIIQIAFVDTIQTDLTDISLNCFGSMASVTPAVSGGIAPFTYSWTTGANTLNTDLGVGSYCLSITDGNGCQATDCIVVSSPTELLASISSTPCTTNGGTDGTATVSPSGGTGPYTYLWSNSGTTQTQTGLSYGIYTVTVTDANGCTREESVVVNEPQCNGFTVSTSFNPVMCNGDSTGSATVTASGGSAPYTYAWNDYASQTSATATNLPGGAYQVIVTDNNGCFAIGVASIFQPAALSNNMTHNDATTLGGTDGSAQVNISGGTGTYSYTWSTAESTAGISNLSAGWYFVDVMDENGCVLQDSVMINEPPCNQYLLYVNTTSPLCNGDANGGADLAILNGVGPFAIDWSTGESNMMSISNVTAGSYSVSVTDGQGCYGNLNFVIPEPAPMSIALLSTPSTCSGANNGTIDMTVVGGTYPYYYYDWSSGQTTQDVINLEPGSYSVTVTDENGCTATDATSLTDPQPIQVSYASTDVTCSGGTDGAIDITVTGGTGTFTYDWSNGATTEDLNNIDVGGYILNVTDGNFCSPNNPITIIVNEPLPVIADSMFANCPTPGELNALFEVFPDGGTPDYSLSFDGGSTYLPYGTFTQMLPTGQSYQLQVMDTNGCVSSVYQVDIDPTVVIDSIIFNPCYPGSQTDELVLVYPQGGTPDYTISYNSGTSFGVLGDYALTLPINDSYYIMAKDSKGCNSQLYSITLPDAFTATTEIANALCYGDNNGGIDLTVSGGTVPYTYAWSNGSTSEDIISLYEGQYSVDITDSNGCVISEAYTITDPDSLYIVLSSPVNSNGQNIDFFGGSNGEIDATVYGGTEPYNYSWDGSGSGDEDLFGLSAGEYLLYVQDNNGCLATASIILIQPMDLALPTAFSPNEDGANEIYNIHGIEAYPDNVLMVFNRWGNKVFEQESYNNYANAWGGENNNGDMLPDGVYFVILQINGDEIEFNTYVHIKTH